MRHLPQIFEKLNLSKENGLFFISDDNWWGMFSNRVEKLLKNVIRPDAFFSIDNKPFILFFESLDSKKEKLREIWNFNESPIVIISEGGVTEIYNGFEYITQNESLGLFGKNEKLNDFSYFELVTGKTWEKYRKEFNYSNRIDFHLLNNIKAARNLLISKGMSVELTSSILGKVIFVRYLIDREVQLDFEREGKSRKWTNSEFCEVLKDKRKAKAFFKYLKKKFNGDLFPIKDGDIDLISEDCLSIIVDLLSGNEVASGQVSLFNLYDFSIIPVEFISNVYELFIGQNKQEDQGAYYTPLFLVDYILSETVEKKFIDNPKSFNCRVLDPSCGSGIFLVETLRKIIEQYQLNNPSYSENPDHYKKRLILLASENIFGIDKDPKAVNVAIFSIYLTLLDYQNPSDIETFKFPLLKNKNFFTEDFFDSKARFIECFKDISFEFILGNPPWKRGKGESQLYFNQYIKNRRKIEKGKHDNEIEISNNEIAQAFILRVSDFCRQDTRIGFIVTSKALYNLNAKGFRKYLLDQFSINKVLELAPVRKEVFDKSNDKAVAPASILFYQFAFGKNTDDNAIEHITLNPSRFFSLFKVFTIQRGDFKKVTQGKLKDFDYLWKVLVYGSYLDFNLINRLKESFPSLDQILSDGETFLIGQGAMIGGGDENDSTHLIGKPFLDTKKDIKRFWVNQSPRLTWHHETVHRPRNASLYEAPFLLITGGTNKHFRAVAAISEKDAVFRSSLTAIKSINNDIDILKSICAILNSGFYAYFGLQTHSSLGIEREESHDEEKLNIPFCNSKLLVSIVNELSALNQRLYSCDILLEGGISERIKQKEFELDSEVISAFNFTSQEKDLIDYSNQIVIPMLMKHPGYKKVFNPISPNSRELIEYTNLFLERFNKTFEKTNQELIIEIHHTNQLIGLFFNLSSKREEAEPINFIATNNVQILSRLSVIGNARITDRLFIQKDIRGFEKGGFYIVKPNEKRLWHKAIAHLDLNEFTEAIFSAGKKHTINVR